MKTIKTPCNAKRARDLSASPRTTCDALSRRVPFRTPRNIVREVLDRESCRCSPSPSSRSSSLRASDLPSTDRTQAANVLRDFQTGGE